MKLCLQKIYFIILVLLILISLNIIRLILTWSIFLWCLWLLVNRMYTIYIYIIYVIHLNIFRSGFSFIIGELNESLKKNFIDYVVITETKFAKGWLNVFLSLTKSKFYFNTILFYVKQYQFCLLFHLTFLSSINNWSDYKIIDFWAGLLKHYKRSLKWE